MLESRHSACQEQTSSHGAASCRNRILSDTDEHGFSRIGNSNLNPCLSVKSASKNLRGRDRFSKVLRVFGISAHLTPNPSPDDETQSSGEGHTAGWVKPVSPSPLAAPPGPPPARREGAHRAVG